MAKNIIMISGKRKSAVAKAKLTPGNGEVLYNGLSYEKLQLFHKLALSEPIEIAKQVVGELKFNIETRARGGGKESQIQAARLAIAKALVAATKSDKLKEAYVQYDRHMLVADTRRKEQYKPGDSKARSKRQKSYR